MTAPMTMNRVIHAAVRRDLDRLDDALARMADGDVPRAQALERAYRNLHDELHHHHVSEDTHIWPMLASVGVDQQLLDAMESEHSAMAEALRETGAAMTTVASSGSRTDAAAARDSLRRTRDVTERHLQHEETELEPLLAPHHDSPEWKAVEKKLRKQPLPATGRFFAWLTDGMSQEHRTFFRQTVPPPVVAVLSRIFGRRYHREVAPTWR